MHSIAKSFSPWIFSIKKLKHFDNMEVSCHIICVVLIFRPSKICSFLLGCLVVYFLMFRSKILHSYEGRHHFKGKTVKITDFTAYDLWARKDLYRVMSDVTKGFGLCGLFLMAAPYIFALHDKQRYWSIPPSGNPVWGR